MTQTNDRPFRVLTAGYVTLDLIIRDLDRGDYWQSVGGTCGNVSVFASALGADVSILARIGHDLRGERLFGSIQKAGVNTTGIERVADFSTPAIVELVRGTRNKRHKFAFVCPSCGQRLPKAAVVSKQKSTKFAEVISEYDAFFFDRATPATVSLARAARNAGLLVVFEPNSVPKTALAESAASLCDILKIALTHNETHLRWRAIQGMTSQFIVETLGGEGVRLRTRSNLGEESLIALPPANQPCIRDEAGAGDWLSAGLIVALMAHPNPRDKDALLTAIDYGQRLSAISLAFDGPGGALTALGAPRIDQMARSNLPLRIPPGIYDNVKKPRAHEPGRSNICFLCLSDQGDPRPISASTTSSKTSATT